MAKTPQTETQSVLDHGNSVWVFTQRILNKDFEGMRIPDWFQENYDDIINSLHDLSIVEDYNILHDCGKPYCIQYDDDGRKHFPNHAEVSKQTYLSLPKDDSSSYDANTTVANLIGWDMVLHTATAEEIAALNLSKADAYTLLVTAFAEIHSNALMFGGIESVSFKSKWKKLDRRGRAFVKSFESQSQGGLV